jgi:hypothetical protein
METLGLRQVSVCLPIKVLAAASLGTGRSASSSLPWRTWDWTMAEVGRSVFALALVLGEARLEGVVSGLVLDRCLTYEAARARLMPLCPLCSRRLCKRGFLLAEKAGGRLRVGCSRCVPPPASKDLPSAVEVRAALEALSRRTQD